MDDDLVNLSDKWPAFFFLLNAPRISLRSFNGKYVRYKRAWLDLAPFLEADYYHSGFWQTFSNTTDLFQLRFENDDLGVCGLRTQEGQYWTLCSDNRLTLQNLFPGRGLAPQQQFLLRVHKPTGRIGIKCLANGKYITVDPLNTLTGSPTVSQASLFQVNLKVAIKYPLTGKYVTVLPSGQLQAVREVPRANELNLIGFEGEGCSITAANDRLWFVEETRQVSATAKENPTEGFQVEALSSLRGSSTRRVVIKTQSGRPLRVLESGDLRVSPANTGSSFASVSSASVVPPEFELFYYTVTPEDDLAASSKSMNFGLSNLFGATAAVGVAAVEKKVFGQALPQIVERERSPVPQFVEKTMAVIEKFGLEIEGIFRVSGRAAEIELMRKAVDAGQPFEDVSELASDVHSFTGLLKLFLRLLPEPLLTHSQYKNLISASEISEDSEKIAKYKELLEELPVVNKRVLNELVCLLGKVVEKVDINKMTPANIAIVFAPNLLADKNSPFPNLTSATAVVEDLLIHRSLIFPLNVPTYIPPALPTTSTSISTTNSLQSASSAGGIPLSFSTPSLPTVAAYKGSGSVSSSRPPSSNRSPLSQPSSASGSVSGSHTSAVAGSGAGILDIGRTPPAPASAPVRSGGGGSVSRGAPRLVLPETIETPPPPETIKLSPRQLSQLKSSFNNPPLPSSTPSTKSTPQPQQQQQQGSGSMLSWMFTPQSQSQPQTQTQSTPASSVETITRDTRPSLMRALSVFGYGLNPTSDEKNANKPQTQPNIPHRRATISEEREMVPMGRSVSPLQNSTSLTSSNVLQQTSDNTQPSNNTSAQDEERRRAKQKMSRVNHANLSQSFFVRRPSVPPEYMPGSPDTATREKIKQLASREQTLIEQIHHLESQKNQSNVRTTSVQNRLRELTQELLNVQDLLKSLA